ncbi:sigma-70 family RNA polymerase sigma factor [Sorangium sp. So ce291]|uniref:sigma-70 family RNA polymerase sigma factor n=1 Tax=Sorangium sp. So ce291 TaxID=3133294 RepID=UPI003F5EB4CF
MGREPLAEVSFEELLRRARAGEHDALEVLFQRCRPVLDRWASRRFSGTQPGGARPSDTAQETAERAFRQFSTFEGSTAGEWFTWLERIFHSRAAQSARDARRKKRVAPGTVPLDAPEAQAAPADQKSPSQAVSRTEEWRRLLALLYELPDDQRDAIGFCHLKELSVAEAAQRMGKTKPAVEGLLQRGLRTLRARMAEDASGEPTAPTIAPVHTEAAVAALVVYLRRRDAGEIVDAEAFIAEYSACAAELRLMLHWIDRIQALRPSGTRT